MATRAAILPAVAPGGDSAAAEGDVEQLGGVVERVVYHSRESGFCVLRVRVPEQRKLATVVGHAPSVVAGEAIAATGSWVWHRSHGLQFRATALSSALSAGAADGVESCLGAGLLKGIGPTYARRLLGAFGDRLFEVIEREPERLREVPGIGLARAERIAACWTEQRALREIMLFLHDHGLGGSRALRIYEAYGPGAVELVRADPYRLARDIPGIAFTAADSVAARLGLAPDDPVRVRAGLAQVVAAARGEGHAGLPLPDAVQRAADLLGLRDAAVARAVAAGEAEAAGLVRDLLGGRPHAFAADLHGDELTVARRLRALASGTLPWPAVDPVAALERTERAAGLVLSECQRRALNKVLLSKVAVVTGGPGVGKTLLVKAVLEVLRGSGVRALLAAPTGRAAKRLSELTGREARTLHRLLEVTGARDRETFRRTEANPLEADLVVVDETSMVDVPLLAALLRAVPDRAALLLVGDVDQLPPIGPGQALADLIASGAVPTARIDEVLRQPPGSRIVANA
ncbi:MAG TPA: AAA family ATPase, partial [Geminicoccaceae bacterium]|nr:AAA family ATPase [Geminicoccaceae bacterium]